MAKSKGMSGLEIALLGVAGALAVTGVVLLVRRPAHAGTGSSALPGGVQGQIGGGHVTSVGVNDDPATTRVQTRLGLTADGDWGPNTARAVAARALTLGLATEATDLATLTGAKDTRLLAQPHQGYVVAVYNRILGT